MIKTGTRGVEPPKAIILLTVSNRLPAPIGECP